MLDGDLLAYSRRTRPRVAAHRDVETNDHEKNAGSDDQNEEDDFREVFKPVSVPFIERRRAIVRVLVTREQMTSSMRIADGVCALDNRCRLVAGGEPSKRQADQRQNHREIRNEIV